MNNDSPFNFLYNALIPYKEVLSKACDAILDQEVSNYPIFILSKDTIDVGVPLIDELTGFESWSINASMLEEFTAKQIVQMERVDNFIEIYKDPRLYFCFFIVDQGAAQFVFFPRKSQSKNGVHL